MRNRWIVQIFVGCAFLLAGLLPSFAGDSLYGKVTEVRSGDVVVLNYGTGQHVIRIIGIDVPKEGSIAAEAKQAVARLVLGKNARIRLEGLTQNGEMEGQLLTADPDIGIKDVGLELVRAGLASREKGQDIQFEYKYGELTAAENEAREAKRGLWATAQPQ